MTPDNQSADQGQLSSLQHFVRPLQAFLLDPEVTEICMQRPAELFIERRSAWQCAAVPWATDLWARHFARLLATASSQRVSAEAPLLSATLPGGERVQIVLPPASGPDGVVIAIRKPAAVVWSLCDLADRGAFSHGGARSAVSVDEGAELRGLYKSGAVEQFLGMAVRRRLNILVAGATGSGKTTLTKALILEIPRDERLISIEDAAELGFAAHRNSVRLFYSKDNQGRAQVTPKQLLEAALRLRPDRILLAELRGEEAYHFLRNVSSGHPGSITSIHAGTAALAFEQLALLVKESAAGRDMSLGDIHRLSRAVIDVVVCCRRHLGRREIHELWWRDGDTPD
ncbi:MAG: P-type DNA transfer ATPase VirB11 [Pseudomonadota bacterium]